MSTTPEDVTKVLQGIYLPVYTGFVRRGERSLARASTLA